MSVFCVSVSSHERRYMKNVGCESLFLKFLLLFETCQWKLSSQQLAISVTLHVEKTAFSSSCFLYGTQSRMRLHWCIYHDKNRTASDKQPISLTRKPTHDLYLIGVTWAMHTLQLRFCVPYLWTPLKVLRESLSSVTLKDLLSSVRILTLVVRIFDSWEFECIWMTEFSMDHTVNNFNLIRSYSWRRTHHIFSFCLRFIQGQCQTVQV